MDIGLGHIELSRRCRVQLFLEHSLVNYGYGECESVFVPRPFITDVYVDAGTMIWRAPSGDVFRCRQRMLAAGNEPLGASFAGIYWATDRTGSSIEVRGGWQYCEVFYGGFVMTYKCGSLVRIETPEGDVIIVEALGRLIRRLFSGGREICSVLWGGDRIRELAFGHRRYFFTGSGRRIYTVETSAGFAALFRYDLAGLICDMRVAGKSVPIAWRALDEYPRMDSSYRNPFVIDRFGERKYKYYVGGNRVRMEEDSDSGGRRVLLYARDGSRLRLVKSSETK